MPKVKAVRAVPHKGKVHDLNVEGRHSYNAEGLAVHNSAAGSLVSYCLNLTDIDPLPHGLLFERFLDESRPDPPDIDTDFDPRVRQAVKDHIVEKFGTDYTCSIGTYQTYKTKAVIIDVARTFGLDVHEANMVTKQMDSLQSFENDEGEEEKVDKMSFDELEKHYPELKEYFDRYPEVKLHAGILRNQVKNMGKHAGGVIISDLNLQGRIPVQLDANGDIVSSWAESGSAAELSKVGLVKYDILGLNNLPVIADCIELVKEHRGIEIKRSDVPIDDREAIRMGAKRDLVGIFQFENPATREIVEAVEMESLADVSAITSLLRPGPKDMGMHEEYALRKHGQPYDMPEFMREALKDTFGVITYQEQCCPYDVGVLTPDGYIKIGDIVTKQAATKVLCVNNDGDVVEREITHLHDNGEKDVYRFVLDNGLVLECTDDHKILTSNRGWVEARNLTEEDDIVTTDEVAKIVSSEYVGRKPVYDLTVDEHHNFIANGVVVHNCMKLSQILAGFTGPESNKLRKAIGKKLEELMAEMKQKFIKGAQARVEAGEITNEEVLEVWGQLEAFAGYGFNKSHAVAYSAITTAQLWLKYHYPVEYITALAMNTKQGKKKSSIGVSNLLVHYLNYGRKRGFEVLPPDVNKSSVNFTIENNQIRFSLDHIKNVASAAQKIAEIAPYESISDFYEKCVYEQAIKTGKNAGKMRTTRPNKKVVESLIASGAFDELATEGKSAETRRNSLMQEYYGVKKGKKEEPPQFTAKQWKTKEVEVLGLCLSEPPLLKTWSATVAKKGWTTIDEAGDRKKVLMFGQIMGIRAHTSKKGNSMHIVTLSDGIDSIDFFVFEGGRQFFFDHYKTGNIVAIPLKKFDDGNTRFFDEYGDGIVVAS